MPGLLIANGNLKKGQLSDTTVLLTGGGGGIGFETVRALVWLGARVAIAELNRRKGEAAERTLADEFGPGKASFFEADISDERRVASLCQEVERKLGPIHVLFNNATIAPMGAAHTVGVARWDESYGVNLRGPVLLLERLLPGMLERRRGTIIFVSSSGAAPYMGAYETFKTAQVELCNTLASELEGTGVLTFSIGPGIVKTETASHAILQIAPLLGKSVEELFTMNEAVLLTPEEAGVGFAAAVVLAERYNGMEVSSVQALADAGLPRRTARNDPKQLNHEEAVRLRTAFAPVLKTYREQSAGWLARNIFERQWIRRDFKKVTGLAVDLMAEELQNAEKALDQDRPPARSLIGHATRLREYYAHQKAMMMSYEKDRAKADANAMIIEGWVQEVDHFVKAMNEVNI